MIEQANIPINPSLYVKATGDIEGFYSGMLTLNSLIPRFSGGSAPPGRKLPMRHHGYVPREYADVVRQAEAAFPEAVRKVLHDEGVTLVLTGNRPGLQPSSELSPFEYKPRPGDQPDEKTVYLSPGKGNAWHSRERFFRVVIQSLAQVLRASSVEMLFDGRLQDAFDSDYEKLDRRLGMFMEAVSSTHRLTDFRQKMAFGRGGLQTMLEAVGYCIAEHCTGESLLNETFPDITRPAASIFPELYEAVSKHLPEPPSMAERFFANNPGLKEKLGESDTALLENLLSDPLGRLHHDTEYQQTHAELAAQAIGLLMEDIPAGERKGNFYQPFNDIREQLWGLWRQLQEEQVIMDNDEAIKLISCMDRTDALLSELSGELSKENRYENGEVMDFFVALQRQYEADPDANINIYEYVATVLCALPRYQKEDESKDAANRLLQPFYNLAVRLEASGDQASARACDRLVQTLEAKLAGQE